MDTIKIDSKGVKMVAHRGLSGLERENTYPAFIAAGNRSYYGIETDVHKTADGKFVVIHDETTDRVSNGKTNIDVEMSKYDVIKEIVLPDLDGSLNRRDIRIPLLIDYIKICKKYEKVCVLELKNSFLKSDIEKMIAQIITEDYLDGMIFISFDINNCIKIRKILDRAKIQWLAGRKPNADDMKTIKNYRLDLDIHYSALNKDIVNTLHDLGIEVNCWTCDNKEDAEKLVEMGVDYITTNVLE